MQNYPAFLFGHKIIQVVDDYVYLGIKFNYNGSFNKAISKQVLQGKKAFYALLDKVHRLCLPVDISLELLISWCCQFCYMDVKYGVLVILLKLKSCIENILKDYWALQISLPISWFMGKRVLCQL